MSDLATLQHNEAFSLNADAARTSSTPTPTRSHSHTQLDSPQSHPSRHDRRSSTPSLLPPSSHSPRPSRPPSAERARRKQSTPTSSSSSSSPSSSSAPSPRNRSSRSPQPQPPTPAPPPPPALVPSVDALRYDADADEEQWLLHNSRAARVYSEQLSHPPSPHYPNLIEQGLIVDDSRDEDADVQPEQSPSPSTIRRPLPFDLLSSYEQLHFVRFAPDLFSVQLTLHVFAAIGLLQEQWPLKAEDRERGEGAWWGWAVWLWQSLWAVLFVCGLGWVVWVDVMEPQQQLTVHRIVLAVCASFSLSVSLLLAHHILAYRLLTTRIYYLHRNSRTPGKAADAVDRVLYASLVVFFVLAMVGLHIDLQRRPSTLALAPPTVDPSAVEGRDVLFLLCLLVLRLQFTAGLSLLTSLLLVHALRVDQATVEVQATFCDEPGMQAQLVDVDLAVRDASSRLGWKVAVIAAACMMDAALHWLQLIGPHPSTERASVVAVLYDCAVLLWVGWGLARLSGACGLMSDAVTSFAMLRSSVRPIARPVLGFEVVGYRVAFSGLLWFVLVVGVALLWAAQVNAAESGG